MVAKGGFKLNGAMENVIVLVLVAIVVVLLIRLFTDVSPVEYVRNLLSGKNKELENFDTEPEHKFVFYFAPWCPHCTSVKPQWDEWKSSLENDTYVNSNGLKILLESVDCTLPENTKVAEDEQIQGFPTWKFHHSSGQKSDYNSSRDVAGFTKFLDTMSA